MSDTSTTAQSGLARSSHLGESEGSLGRFARLLTCIFIAVAVAFAVLAVENVAAQSIVGSLTRLNTDFSAAYLSRQLRQMSVSPPDAVLFGDSVLWGYHLPAKDTAVALLSRQGCACDNLAFKAGGPPNYYALSRLMLKYKVHPRVVVIEVNQMLFNRSDAWYSSLHPAVAAQAWPLLSTSERALLTPPKKTAAKKQWFDEYLASVSALYSMRSDIRETLFPPADPPTAKMTSDELLGTYDLTPLDTSNVGVRFLDDTVKVLRASGIPVIAFMTPTNHLLMHDYVDVPEYAANVAFIERLLAADGAVTRNMDHKFEASEFYDNDHLTSAGQKHLARLLAQLIHAYAPTLRNG